MEFDQLRVFRIKEFVVSRSMLRFASKFLLLGVLTSNHIYAFELSANFSSGVEYTSNARGSSTETEEDVLHQTGLGVTLEEERKNIRADANIRIDHEHYYNDTFDDELALSSGFGLFSVDLIEQFFNWQATFSRTDVLSDSSDEVNPDTREYRTILRTGPTITYAFSRATNFRFGSNYVVVENSGSDSVDSKRADSSLGLDYQINSLTSVNFNTRYEKTLESDDDEKLEQSDWSVGFDRRFVNGVFRFSVGRQRVQSNLAITESEDQSDSNFFDVSFNRQNFLGHSVALSYSEQTSDTALGFELEESDFDDDSQRIDVVAVTDIETRKLGSLRVAKDTSTFAYDVTTNYQESIFERAETIERYRALILGVQPKFMARLTPRFEYRYVREDFGRDAPGEDVTRVYRLSAAYEAVKDVYLNAALTYENVDNDESSVRESEDIRLALGLRWDFL